MERALVVEDAEKWQNFHRGFLEPIIGKKNVDVVANYNDALSMLGRDYRAYVLDVQFPTLDTREVTNEIDLNTRRSKER